MIYPATVKSSYDTDRSGKIYVECPDLNYSPCNVLVENDLIKIKGKCLEVTYTTPYFKPTKGGFFSPPADNAQILIFEDQIRRRHYYLSTIVDMTSVSKTQNSEDLLQDPIIDQLELYEDGVPAATTLKNMNNDGLGMYFKRSTTRYINKTTLKNGKKELSLDSSPEVDCVKLSNGHGDYLKISGIPESSNGVIGPPKRALEARTFLNQNFVSDRGGVDLTVMDGKEITLENRSSGFFSWAGLFGPRSGNINLFSKYKNINISAKAPFYVPTEGPNSGGKVMIETGNSQVTVSRDGVTIRMNTSVPPGPGSVIAGPGNPRIEVKATGDIVIDAGGPFSTIPTAGGTLTLKAGNIELLATNVTIGAAATLTTNATTVTTINSGGAVNIDGAFVNLNSGAAATAGPAAISAATAVPEFPVNVTPSEYPTATKYF